MANQELLRRTFVELADTLVDSFDLIDFLHLLTDRCVALLGVGEAGVVLADPTGKLRALASSSEIMRTLELLELQSEDGPCLDAWHTGEAVMERDLANPTDPRWPQFSEAARAAGFRSVYALPMRVRADRIGALNLFADTPIALSNDDLALGRALADVASIGILQERFARDQNLVTDQLQNALTSRVLIEQAKGMIAEQAKLDMDQAFDLIRQYARSRQRRLSDIVSAVIDRELDAGALRRPAQDPSRR